MNEMFWHQTHWQHIKQRLLQGNLPHALLLAGPEGLGKKHFSEQLAQIMVCSSAGQAGQFSACGTCHACRLFHAGTHPDVLRLYPEAKGKAITVDGVRSVGEFLSLKSQLGKFQVVIVAPAEAMNRFAANSLLKTLEEPTANTLILLISHQPAALLPTIRSRCQTLYFSVPANGPTQEWLKQQLADAANPTDSQLANLLIIGAGAPLTALHAAQNATLETYSKALKDIENIVTHRSDPLRNIKLWTELGLELGLQWLYGWICELIRLKSVPGRVDNKTDTVIQPLHQVVAQVSLSALLGYLDEVLECLRIAHGQVNVTSLWEGLLIKWSELPNNS